MNRLAALLFVGAAAFAGKPRAASEPAPSPAEQRAMLARVTQNALHSQDQLPDFICTQLTRRSEDHSGKGKKFKLRDSLEVEFTFVGGRPDWKLVRVDGRAARRSYADLKTGFLSDTILQFFSLPGSVFGESAQTRFNWSRWDALDGRRTEVFSFRVPVSASQLALTSGGAAAVVGYHGFMFADASTDALVRLEIQLELPRRSDAKECSINVDYGGVAIADRQFLLPVSAVAEMRTPAGLARNETEVVRYQKYSADSSVTFGEPAR